MHTIKSRRFPVRPAVIYEGDGGGAVGLKKQFQGTRSEARETLSRATQRSLDKIRPLVTGPLM